MMNMQKRVEIWEKLDLDQKYEYWKALEVNNDILHEKKEEEFSFSSEIREPKEEEKGESGISSSFVSESNKGNERNVTAHIMIESNSADGYLQSDMNESQIPEEKVVNGGINPVQVELWKITFKNSSKDVLNLWNNYFSWPQRVKLWNSIEYSSQLFELYKNFTLNKSLKL